MSDKYHCPIININNVTTKGNAGYRVWKFAGGHGDHDISLPLGLLVGVRFFVLDETDSFVANPLLIFEIKN